MNLNKTLIISFSFLLLLAAAMTVVSISSSKGYRESDFLGNDILIPKFPAVRFIGCVTIHEVEKNEFSHTKTITKYGGEKKLSLQCFLHQKSNKNEITQKITKMY